MANSTLEERVAVLETKIEQMEQRQEPDKSGDTVPWWKKIVGVYQDCPEFEEVVRFGQEWRRQEPSANEEEA